jgi:glutamate-1-semialdehyde 2,1-aminomutase
MQKRTVEASWALHDRAVEVIPMATQTHSKAPREGLRGVEPCYLVRGKGGRVWGVDGNEYIDFRNGLGPVILGYCFPEVDRAVREQLESGVVFSYSHPLEVEVAERLVAHIPCAESVRFLKTGGEAMAATHRLARGFSGRDLIVSCGYHGWLNTTTGVGVPEETRSVYRNLPWGAIEPYSEILERESVAAVSVACSYADIEKGTDFLRALRELTQHHGALLIFDEIVTGFRLHPAGAQGYFGVTPDLGVFAKGLSNGVPLSCYLGRREVMDAVREVVVSSTFGGDTLGLAAARAVLDFYEENDVVGAIWDRGRQLHEGFGAICERLNVPASFQGLPPLGQLTFSHPDAKRDAELFLRFNGEVLRRGVIIYNICYPNFSHTPEDIDQALRGMEDGLVEMKQEGLFD